MDSKVEYKTTSDITAYKVSGDKGKALNYDNIFQFGAESISTDLLEKIRNIRKDLPLHPLLSRQIVYAHRDLEKMLHLHSIGKPFYIYTGRGASSKSLHLGHLNVFSFTKYLQDLFDTTVVIQMTDDEKFLFNDKLSLDQCKSYAIENIKDIIACGFNPKKTFIFQNTEYMGEMYSTVLQVQKCLPFNQIKSAFGFELDGCNIGKVSYPPLQIAPCFSQCFSTQFNNQVMPCLIPCAVDQDVFFKLSRDIAHKLKLPKPSVIHSKFLPSLLGVHEKMSASDEKSVIFMTDTPSQIIKKIKSAMSGSTGTLEQHRKTGANLDLDVAFQYLRFVEPDDEKLNNIADTYKKGTLTSPEVKKILTDIVLKIVVDFQLARAQVIDEVVAQFKCIRNLPY